MIVLGILRFASKAFICINSAKPFILSSTILSFSVSRIFCLCSIFDCSNRRIWSSIFCFLSRNISLEISPSAHKSTRTAILPFSLSISFMLDSILSFSTDLVDFLFLNLAYHFHSSIINRLLIFYELLEKEICLNF